MIVQTRWKLNIPIIIQTGVDGILFSIPKDTLE